MEFYDTSCVYCVLAKRWGGGSGRGRALIGRKGRVCGVGAGEPEGQD